MYKIIVMLIIAFSVIFLVILLVNKEKKGTVLFDYAIFNTGNGFGYVIYRDTTVLFKQGMIPAIPKNISFCSEKEAEKIAKVVVYKLNKGKIPKITKEELKRLDINTNCPE